MGVGAGALPYSGRAGGSRGRGLTPVSTSGGRGDAGWDFRVLNATIWLRSTPSCAGVNPMRGLVSGGGALGPGAGWAPEGCEGT